MEGCLYLKCKGGITDGHRQRGLKLQGQLLTLRSQLRQQIMLLRLKLLYIKFKIKKKVHFDFNNLVTKQ